MWGRGIPSRGSKLTLDARTEADFEPPLPPYPRLVKMVSGISVRRRVCTSCFPKRNLSCSFKAGTVTDFLCTLHPVLQPQRPLSCSVLRDGLRGARRGGLAVLLRAPEALLRRALCLACLSPFSALQLLLLPQDLTEKLPLPGSLPEPWAAYTICPPSSRAHTLALRSPVRCSPCSET